MFQNLRRTPALNEQPGKGCEFSTAAFSTERERVLKHMVLRASLLNTNRCFSQRKKRTPHASAGVLSPFGQKSINYIHSAESQT
jgi:hypothetical protein